MESGQKDALNTHAPARPPTTKSSAGKRGSSPAHLHTALTLNAFLFPGAGYFFIGRKLKGVLVVCAAAYFLILPLVRFTRTMFALSVPLSRSDAVGSGVLSALPLAWQAHRGLILWSLAGIVVLWVFGILDVWYTIRRSERHGMYT